MFEVFNYKTGETLGYTDDERIAKLYTVLRISSDYINADEEESCLIGGNPHF